MNEENRWGLNTYVCEAPLCKFRKGGGFGSLLHHPWWLSCQVAKGRFPRGPGAPGFKGHLDAESWTVVHKQHSDMCSEHPISWNTNRARAIWRTGDQFEKCEQLKHIFTIWSNSIASWNAQENTWKKTKGYGNEKVYLYKATLQYTEHTEKYNTENRVQWGTKEQPVILYWPIIVFLLRLFTHCD